MAEKWSAEGVPRRELNDPRTLRALAHPLRWQILDQLVVHGPATATDLAERLDQSASNLSWHLRQLAKHGFIEEAEGGTGRQRPWRFVLQTTGFSPSTDHGSELARAQELFLEMIREQDLQALRAWQDRRHREPAQWRGAAFLGSSNYIWLTADELAAFGEELNAVIERHLMPHVDRLDPARRPAGSRPVRFTLWAVPSGPPQPGSPSQSAAGSEPTSEEA
jgi:DNA-binding transcriptional ArsR family regulator